LRRCSLKHLGDGGVFSALYLKESDVTEFLDMTSCIQALRDAFAAEASGQANIVPRTRWPFGAVRLNVMGGGERPSKRFAVKCYGGGAFHVLLYAEDKGLLAIVEANVLGAIRTGAASAVASEKMATPGAGKVAPSAPAGEHAGVKSARPPHGLAVRRDSCSSLCTRLAGGSARRCALRSRSKTRQPSRHRRHRHQFSGAGAQQACLRPAHT
jgi:hypothetical protein